MDSLPACMAKCNAVSRPSTAYFLLGADFVLILAPRSRKTCTNSLWLPLAAP